MMHLRTAAAILVLSATVLSAAGCTNKPGSDGPSPLGLASSSPDEGHTNGPTGAPAVRAHFTFPGRWHEVKWTVGGATFGVQVPIGWTEQVLDGQHRTYTSPDGQVDIDLEANPNISKDPVATRDDDLAKLAGLPGYQAINDVVQPGKGGLTEGRDGAAYDYLLDRNGESRYFIGMWIGYTDLDSTVLRITVSYPNAMDDGEKGSGAGVFSRAVASVKIGY